MKEYTISIHGVTKWINNLTEMLDWTDDDEKIQDSLKKDIEYLRCLPEVITMSTLEEYFTMLEKLNNITDHNVSIWNDGTWLELESD